MLVKDYYVIALLPEDRILKLVDRLQEKIDEISDIEKVSSPEFFAHVTLSCLHIYNDGDVDAIEKMVEDHVHNIGQKSSRLLGFGSFLGGENDVLFLNLVIKQDLLGCQKSFYKQLNGYQDHVLGPHLEPEQWAPHMTLHADLKQGQIARVIDHIYDDLYAESGQDFVFDKLVLYRRQILDDGRKKMVIKRVWPLKTNI